MPNLTPEEIARLRELEASESTRGWFLSKLSEHSGALIDAAEEANTLRNWVHRVKMLLTFECGISGSPSPAGSGHDVFVGVERMRDEIAALRAENAALREDKGKDTERMDWIEKQVEEYRYDADFAIQQGEEDGVWFTRIVRYDSGELPSGFTYESGKQGNVREAIDAARAALENKTP